MKTLLVILALIPLTSALAGKRYPRDENHDPDMIRQEEEERRDIHKPGDMKSDDDMEGDTQEMQDSKETDPGYDPIDDDLEEPQLDHDE